MTRLALLLALLLCGCLKPRPVDPPAPEPDVVAPVAGTEMDRYFAAFRTNIGRALGETAAKVDGLSEAAARDLLAAKLLDAVTRSHGELSAADAALSASGFTTEKFKAVLLRRQQEALRGQ